MNAAERARKCFTLAAHPATPAGEASAALERGLAILERHGLDPDEFVIPGRERAPAAILAQVEAELAQHQGGLGDIFGTCISCGAVASVGAVCQACAWAMYERTCEHGQHGYCPWCEGWA